MNIEQGRQFSHRSGALNVLNCSDVIRAHSFHFDHRSQIWGNRGAPVLKRAKGKERKGNEKERVKKWGMIDRLQR